MVIEKPIRDEFEENQLFYIKDFIFMPSISIKNMSNGEPVDI